MSAVTTLCVSAHPLGAAVAVENPRPGQATAAAGGAGTPPQALPIVVDETSAQRCRVLMARNSGESFKPLASTVSSRPDPERTGHYFVSLISRQADGSRKNHGGSIFMGSMYRYVGGWGRGGGGYSLLTLPR